MAQFLSNSAVENNSAKFDINVNTEFGGGGGICNFGVLTVSNSTVLGNTLDVTTGGGGGGSITSGGRPVPRRRYFFRQQ